MNENLNHLINIKKYKTDYLSELAEFEKKITQNINEIDTKFINFLIIIKNNKFK